MPTLGLDEPPHAPAASARAIAVAAGVSLRLTEQHRTQGLKPERPPQDLLHDLIGAPADRSKPRVARGALDLVFSHVAIASVNLQTGVHDLERGPLRGELGDRDLAHGIFIDEVSAQRVVGHVAPSLDY